MKLLSKTMWVLLIPILLTITTHVFHNATCLYSYTSARSVFSDAILLRDLRLLLGVNNLFVSQFDSGQSRFPNCVTWYNANMCPYLYPMSSAIISIIITIIIIICSYILSLINNDYIPKKRDVMWSGGQALSDLIGHYEGAGWPASAAKTSIERGSNQRPRGNIFNHSLAIKQGIAIFTSVSTCK